VQFWDLVAANDKLLSITAAAGQAERIIDSLSTLFDNAAIIKLLLK
jgi:hypothetical protein